MSAWKKSFADAPRDGTQFLVRHERWACPAVIHYDMDADVFIFSEECIADIGSVVLPDQLMWAPLPLQPRKVLRLMAATDAQIATAIEVLRAYDGEAQKGLQDRRMKLPISHAEAMDIIRSAATITPLSYDEAIAIYLRATGLLSDGAAMLGAPVPDDWKPRAN